MAAFTTTEDHLCCQLERIVSVSLVESRSEHKFMRSLHDRDENDLRETVETRLAAVLACTPDASSTGLKSQHASVQPLFTFCRSPAVVNRVNEDKDSERWRKFGKKR